MSTDLEIKMGSKNPNPVSPAQGLNPTVIHTGKFNADKPILQVSKVGGGFEHMISEKVETVKKIEITSLMMHKLLAACAEDLSTQRIINVPTSINASGNDQLAFIHSYDARNQIFSFEKDIKYFNTVFGFKDGDLSDFLSNFFYSNINTYSINLFDGIPEILPFTSMETLPNNRVSVLVH